MTTKKTSQLTQATTLVTTDEFVVVKDPAGTPATQRATGTQVADMVKTTISASQFEHDGADPISSIGDADADTYVDTDTVGDGSGNDIRFYTSAGWRAIIADTYTTFRNGQVVVFNTTEGLTEQVVINGNSLDKTTAPPRGVFSRDNTCFAWGRVTVNVTTNTATLDEGHNVDTVTWVSDAQYDVVFHNTCSTSNIAVLTAGNTVTSGDVVTGAFATTGFRFTALTTPGSNWTSFFAVFTKDLT